MRALMLDGRLILRPDYPDPKPAPGGSLVRVRMAGVCGTDLELARGYMTFRGVPGHEFVGRVADSSRADLLGQRVAGEINAACGRCEWCDAGLGRHCPHRTVLGILGRDGAFAEYLCLPDENLIPVPDPVPDEVAVFTEPLAAAYEIFEQLSIAREWRIAVLGDGRLGAIVAMALAAEGFTTLVVAGHHPDKLARLEVLGLTTQMEATLAPGFDLVVDCTGAAAGFARALELVRPRGIVVLKSTAAAADLNLAPIVVNEVTVIGSRCGRFGAALGALVSGRVDPRALISVIFPLEDGVEAMARAAEPSSFKVLLRVPDG